jgi:integrase
VSGIAGEPEDIVLRTATTHIYLSAAEVAALANVCGDQGEVVLILAYTGLRFGELIGLNVEDVDLDARRVRVRRSMTQVGGRLVEGNPKSMAGRRSVPIPERLVPLFKARIDGRPHGAPAVTSRRGSRLSLENWKRSVRGRSAVAGLAATRYASTICDTPTPRCHGGPVRTFACSRKLWATPPSPSPHTLTPTSLTTSWTISPWRSTL